MVERTGRRLVRPGTGLLFVNSNESINTMTLVDACPVPASGFDFKGYTQLLDDEDIPHETAWGWMTAVDLHSGISVGAFHSASIRNSLPRHSADRDHQLRGSIATGGGLVFIGATQDHKFRAFDSRRVKYSGRHSSRRARYATPCT